MVILLKLWKFSGFNASVKPPSFLAKTLNVDWAARIHKVPLDEFLEILHKAVAKKESLLE